MGAQPAVGRNLVTKGAAAGDVLGQQPEELLGLVERGVEVGADLRALLLGVVGGQQRRATGAHGRESLRSSLLQHPVELLDFST